MATISETLNVVMVLHDDEVYLACEDHPGRALQDCFDEGYLQCDSCYKCLMLEQARGLLNRALQEIAELLNLIEAEMVKEIEVV